MKIHDLEAAAGHYRTIYLDPPWPYERRPLGRRNLSQIYQGGVLSLEDLARLPVGKLGHQDRFFFVWLWITWPKLRDGFHQVVLDAWGLKWVSEVLWDKVNMGMGRRIRKQTEPLLLAVPKEAPPGMLLRRSDQRDLVSARNDRSRHSQKPECLRAIIETLTPEPRLELFARRHPPGWDVWGLEAPEACDNPEGAPAPCAGG